MQLPSSRQTKGEEHAFRLACALADLLNSYGMDEAVWDRMETIHECNRVLMAYKSDYPFFDR